MDYYETYLKHKYPSFTCVSDKCNNWIVLKEAMCTKCFCNKYPDILEEVATEFKLKKGYDFAIKERA